MRHHPVPVSPRDAGQRPVPRQPHWLACLALLLAAPSSALAEIYICKDSSGRTITADRPIPECADRPMRQLDANGITRREIAAPLTPEQKRTRDALEEKRRIDKAAADEQRLYDNALTTRYRNEDDIALARRRAVDLLNDQMKIDTNAVALESKDMKSAQAVAATGKPGAAGADRRHLENATRAVESRQASITQRTAEIARTHARFDLALKRFRELRTAQ